MHFPGFNPKKVEPKNQLGSTEVPSSGLKFCVVGGSLDGVGISFVCLLRMNCLKGIERNCFACGYNINERYMLFSDNKYWHSKGCFRCSKCGLDLGGERNAWFKSGMYLCRKDYLSLREPSVNWSRYCFGCKGFIRADMYVLKISASLVFHVQCLCCSKCKNSLKTGDRFCLTADNQGILCYSNCAAVQPGSQSSVAAASNGTAAQGNSNGKGGGKRGRQPMIKK